MLNFMIHISDLDVVTDDHATRITVAEENIQGKQYFCRLITCVKTLLESSVLHHIWSTLVAFIYVHSYEKGKEKFTEILFTYKLQQS